METSINFLRLTLQQPRVLIVTPTLNQGQFISQTLRCVTRQKGPEDLYVVVDGGSTDNTARELERFAEGIDAVYIEPGLSQAEALAFAFSRYEADICCWLNSDDLWLPGTLEFARQYFAQHPGVDVIYGNRLFIDEAGDLQKVWRLPPHLNWLMQRWDYIPQETAFWRQAAMRHAGGIDEDIRFALDYDLFLRMMHSSKFKHIPEFLGVFRIHPSSKTSTENETTGKAEVAALRARHGVTIAPGERLIGRILRHYVEVISKLGMIGQRDRLESLLRTMTSATTSSIPPQG